jgi:hypothetical protein
MIAAAVVGVLAALLLAYVVYSLISKMALRGHLRGTNIHDHHTVPIKSMYENGVQAQRRPEGGSQSSWSKSRSAAVLESAPLIQQGYRA